MLRYLDIAIAIVVLLIAGYAIFNDLDAPSIFIWDEAVYANNAIEMAETGDILTVRNDWYPSKYNVKPPLVIWIEALSLNVFGWNEWALRLPSAIAGFFTCFLLVFFGRRWTGSWLPGALAVLLLIASYGFLRPHVVKSADLDSTLLFFTTGYTLFFISWWTEGRKNFYWWFLIAAFAVLGFYSKSIAGLMPLIPMLLILLFSKEGRNLFSDPRIYIMGGSAVAICLLYYFLRAWNDPNYLRLVIDSEYTRFFKNVMPWHERPFHWYFDNMIRREFFFPVVYLLIPVLIFTVFLKSEKIKRICLLLCGLATIYLLFISIPSIKLEWYDVTVYPLYCLFVAMGLWGGYEWIRDGKSRALAAVFLSIMFLGAGFFSYQQIIAQEKFHQPIFTLEREGHCLRELHNVNGIPRDFKVLLNVTDKEHLDVVKWYQKVYAKEHDYNIGILRNMDQVQYRQRLLVCQKDQIRKLELTWEYNQLDQCGECLIVQTIQPKE